MNSLQAGLKTLFDSIIHTSWQASIFAALILLTVMVFRKRLPPRWQYILWALVAIRLIMPMTPPSAVSIFNLPKLWKTESNALGSIASTQNPSAIDERFQLSSSRQASEHGLKPAAGVVRQEHVSIKVFLSTALPAIWLFVAVFIACRIIWANYRFSGRVLCQRPVTKQAVLDLLEDCKEEIGVRTPLTVLESDDIRYPALLGFVRPRLLLPKRLMESLSRDELRYVFLHELAHVKRLDIPFNWAFCILQIVHWFNPVLWIAFRRTLSERELACDALVLSTTSEQEKEKYGETIIALLESSDKTGWLPGMVGIVEDRTQIRRRIKMIAQYNAGKQGRSVAGISLAILLAVLGLTDSRSTEPPKANPVEAQLDERVAAPDYDALTSSSVFDYSFYLETYPDLKEAFGDDEEQAKMHWVNHGIAEGRTGSPSFNVRYYLNRHSDLAKAFGKDNHVAAIEHWLSHGMQEGRRGTPDYDALTSSSVFDYLFYLETYPDLKEAFGDDEEQTKMHWVNHGIAEGRAGSPSFNVRYYLNRYPDLAKAFGKDNHVAAIEHWLSHGKQEARRGAPDYEALSRPEIFDAEFFLNTYPDLKKAFGNDHEAALNFWLRHGIYEGRVASGAFSARYYLQRNPKLWEAYGKNNYIAAAEHWIEQQAKRKPQNNGSRDVEPK